MERRITPRLDTWRLSEMRMELHDSCVCDEEAFAETVIVPCEAAVEWPTTECARSIPSGMSMEGAMRTVATAMTTASVMTLWSQRRLPKMKRSAIGALENARHEDSMKFLKTRK